MWNPNEVRVLRWFMRFAGIGLIIPGLIYAISWPDTVRAFDQVTTGPLAIVLAGLAALGGILGGASFLLARYARIGAVLAAISLLCGTFVHFQWMKLMLSREPALSIGLDGNELKMLHDTIQFAANAQIPHMLKNLVLVGLCVMVFVLAPRLCGSRIER